MSIDPGSGGAFVQITMGQVYSEVTGMRQDLRDLTHSVQGAVGQLSDHEQRMRYQEQHSLTRSEFDKAEEETGKKITTLGDRVGALEKWRWTTTGATIVISTASGALIGRLLSGH